MIKVDRRELNLSFLLSYIGFLYFYTLICFFIKFFYEFSLERQREMFNKKRLRFEKY